MKQKRWRGKKTVKPHTTTKAVPHIRLLEANSGKLAALDALAPVYLALCQQYTTLFCTNEAPNKLRTPLFQTPLSERWHRVAIQQAAGISQSWWTNRAQAYQDYMEELEEYREQKAEGSLKEGAKEPQWREWDVPTLRQICIQANVNVVKLQPSEDSTFDYWLQISTLELRKPL
ncbi:MAG TPA: transposase, partial [Ktedonobacteraceae bacterium]|nr:transposase [Ktedonobacteraceae bacterium]